MSTQAEVTPPRVSKRLTAFSIHLGISLVILAVPFLLIIFSWYPTPYFSADGGRRGLIIVGSIHLLIGPFLTLLVFTPGKSLGKIRFDLTVIGLLQLSALTLGVYTVHGQRPVAVVFSEGAFHPLISEVIRQQNASLADIEKLGKNAPPLIYSRQPANGEELSRWMLRSLNENLEFYQQVETFDPLAGHLDDLEATQTDIQALSRENPEFRHELREFLHRQNARIQDFVYIPFNGRYKRILFAIDERAALVGALYRAFER
jgi:hypothetical protein